MVPLTINWKMGPGGQQRERQWYNKMLPCGLFYNKMSSIHMKTFQDFLKEITTKITLFNDPLIINIRWVVNAIYVIYRYMPYKEVHHCDGINPANSPRFPYAPVCEFFQPQNIAEPPRIKLWSLREIWPSHSSLFQPI